MSENAPHLQVITQGLVDQVCRQAAESPRLRMNYNFHTDLSDPCQRLLNAMQVGTIMPIHHHKVPEMLIILQGRIRVTLHDDSGKVIEESILDPSEGHYGVQYPAHVWHSLEVLAPDSVIFEAKPGPFIPHEDGGILELKK